MVDQDVKTAANRVKEGGRTIAMEKKGQPLPQEIY